MAQESPTESRDMAETAAGETCGATLFDWVNCGRAGG